MNTDNRRNRLDRATSKRLAMLVSRPVDTSRLERRLVHTLQAEPTYRPTPQSPQWKQWWRPITSAAAAIFVVVTISWFALSGGTSPAIATPVELAQIHFDVTRGLAPHLTVSSVDEANQLLANQSHGIVPIPDLPGAIKSCCLHHYAGTTLTCALIEQGGKLITVVVADGAKLHSPTGEAVRIGDREFIVHTTNGINMVMSHKGDRWLCVMGEVTPDQLINIAWEIMF